MLGGARSGKSRFAEQRAAELGGNVVYVATATASDDEMRERIRHHRESRPRQWETVEAEVGLADALGARLARPDTLLVEDLGILLSNHLFRLADDADTQAARAGEAERAALEEVDALFAGTANLVLVSNEVGMGLVPPFPLGRAFRDALGRVNQAVAARADEVHLLVAGIPIRVKPAG